VQFLETVLRVIFWGLGNCLGDSLLCNWVLLGILETVWGLFVIWGIEEFVGRFFDV